MAGRHRPQPTRKLAAPARPAIWMCLGCGHPRHTGGTCKARKFVGEPFVPCGCLGEGP